MHIESISATKFSRNVAGYLDHVRYTRETIAITKGARVVAELAPPKLSGLPISELAQLIAEAPKLGDAASSMAEDIEIIRGESKNKLENPWE